MSAAAPVELCIPAQELEGVVGPLKLARAWHRLEQRVFVFNRRGHSHGVRLSTCRANGVLRLKARSEESVRRFQESLGYGPIQSVLKNLIGRKLDARKEPHVLAAFSRRQQDSLTLSSGNPLQTLPEIAELMDRLYIDPPFRVEGAGHAGSAFSVLLARVQDPSGKPLAVLGGPGAGKSTLLRRAFTALSQAPRNREDLTPVFLPAQRLSLRDGGAVDWENLPGANAGLGNHLEPLFRAGKLALFIDGLDENTRLLDAGETGVRAFWETAARNRCLIASRSLFYQRHLQNSWIHRLFNGSLGLLHLHDWTPGHAAKLYSSISASRASSGPADPWREISHLSNLSPQALAGKLGPIRLTGLTAWAYAIFFSLNKKGRFPQNEFEILSFLIDLLVRWELPRQDSLLPEDVMRGILGRIAWRAYQGGFQNEGLGDSLEVSAQDVVSVVNESYPFLSDQMSSIFAALGRMPILNYNGEAGQYRLDPVFGSFLASRHLAGLWERGELESLREALGTPLNDAATEFLFQRIDLLDPAGRRRFLAAGQRVYEAALRLQESGRGEGAATSLQSLMQPLARLRTQEAGAFLRRVFRAKENLPLLAVISCGRALAYLEDDEAVDDFLHYLRKDDRVREANRNFYLYWVGDGRGRRAGADWLSLVRSEGWEGTCGWFLKQLVSRHSTALRRIHLFTFCDLAETYGPARADPEEIKILAASLRREAQSAPPSWKRDTSRFLVLLERFGSPALEMNAR